MAISEKGPRLQTAEKRKPFVYVIDGKYRTDFMFIRGYWDRQEFLDRVIEQAESIGVSIVHYESALRRLEEAHGPIENLPEKKRKKLIRETPRPTSPSGRFTMKLFNRITRVRSAENKRKIAESMFEFVTT